MTYLKAPPNRASLILSSPGELEMRYRVLICRDSLPSGHYSQVSPLGDSVQADSRDTRSYGVMTITIPSRYQASGRYTVAFINHAKAT